VTSLLTGKCIVVIGGTTGLGLSAAKACIAAGARVIAVGRNEASCRAAALELGDAARVMTGDACEVGTAERAIERCIAEFGGFDGLYHVAGGSGRRHGDGPVHELTDEGWEKTLNLNLTSLMRSNRAAVRQFLAQGTGGAILNMGSVLGWSPSPRYFATHGYAAAKAAIIGFSKGVASYYAEKDIRVNVIAPGLVETPMSRRAVEDAEIVRFMKTKQPLGSGRIGTAADLDAAVVFMLSDGARYCTGQVLALDRGWTVSEGQIVE
jgi:NAD(P)-dependent dehydrogenase (short-subunit alcohol dehydrogenase family)